MLFKTVALLALSATTLAHPGKPGKRHHHHHTWGTGTGGSAAPTGGAYSANGTDSGAFGAGSSTAASSTAAVSAITETVVPVAATSAAPAAASSSIETGNGLVASSAAAGGQFYGASSAAPSSSSPVAPESAASSSTSCSSTSTSTYTSMEYVTSTISSGISTVSAGGNTQAFEQSFSVPSTSAAAVASSVASTTSSSVAAAVTTASSATSASSASASDSPAGFFQKSSQAGGFGGSSVAPTSVSSVSFGGFSSSAPASVSSVSFGGFSSSTPAALTTFVTAVSSPVSSVSSSIVASSSAAPVATGVSSSGKKGLSYNSAALTSAFDNTGMTWAYNWGSSPSGTLPSGVDYVPMLWGLGETSGWAAAAAAAIAGGSKAALSFNEPDLSSQSNISPSVAATNHIEFMNPLSGQVEIGSPAITNGAGTDPPMGIDWLNAFFTACNGQCKVDFVAFHWYADASDTAYFESYVGDVIAAAAAAGVSKVWLTEFGTTGGDASTFLDTVMPFLDSTAAVEKYAFFMCAAPETLTGTTLNAVGQAYATN